MGMASTDKVGAFPAEPRNVVAGIRRDGRTDRLRAGERHQHPADLRDQRQHRLPIMSFTLIDRFPGRNSTAAGNLKLGTHVTAPAVSR
jgi:hypothetical protein